MAELLPVSTQAYSPPVSVRHDDSLVSVPLNRSIHLTIILPPNYQGDSQHTQATLPQDRLSQDRLPVLYLNDGQDLPKLHMTEVLDSLYQQQAIRPFVLIAIHAGDRIQEYGTAAQADYMNRGSKAARYTDFVLTELLPYVEKHYPVRTDAASSVFAGFSLGGLSAFDIVYHHPDRFSRAGVFSGSFWWRSRAFDGAYSDDTDRIAHQLVRHGGGVQPLRFWFETGTDDETSDRNNNGIIDSIEDTTDLIDELVRKGYRRDTDIRYVEVPGGQHNQETWRAVMPDFLTWAFGR